MLRHIELRACMFLRASTIFAHKCDQFRISLAWLLDTFLVGPGGGLQCTTLCAYIRFSGARFDIAAGPFYGTMSLYGLACVVGLEFA